MTNPQANLQAESPVLPRGVSDGMATAWLLVAAAVLLQMATNGRYGYFRDELYYIATSDHLAWGYVHFSPLASLLLRPSRFLFWGFSGRDSVPAGAGQWRRDRAHRPDHAGTRRQAVRGAAGVPLSPAG